MGALGHLLVSSRQLMERLESALVNCADLAMLRIGWLGGDGYD
jgi:hypothetical protein